MFQTTARRSVLVLALSLFAVPMGKMYAQSASATPSAVTGSDPQPTGVPDPPPPPPKKPSAMVIIMGILTSIGLS